MPVISEGELEFTFPSNSTPIKFDGLDHGLSHCMKAVDFIVEFPEYYLFVEVKDPDNTQATVRRRAKYAEELARPTFPKKITLKYRDSFLYRWAERKTDKPIRYVVLLQLATLRDPDYLAITQTLQVELPMNDPKGVWSRPIADGLAVLNMQTWNALGTYGTVRRV